VVRDLRAQRLEALVEDSDGLEPERPVEAAARVADRDGAIDALVPAVEPEGDRLADGEAPVRADLEGDGEAVE